MHPSTLHSSPVDVLIAGAGPVGLFLACELRLAGVSVLVLERAEDPHSRLKHLPFGLRGLTVPTVEAFDRRGLLDGLAEPPGRHAGHFAGIPIDERAVDGARWTDRLPGPADAGRAATLGQVEAVLSARAQALGVEIRRGAAVEGFAQSDSSVTAHAGGRTFEGRWLVGCDGGRSAVRKAGDFGFAGTEPEATGTMAEVELADPEKLAPGRHATPIGFYAQPRPGFLSLLEFDGGASHRVGPITREGLQAALRRVSGTDVTVTAVLAATTWTDRAYQAARYRDGRVLLAGDAAHVHAPLGGQGLNLGLGDALNLGWKLAATVRGEAPAGLLDSYGAERQPIGARVLDWSRAQMALLRPTPQARALASVLRDLVGTRDGATYFAERVRNVSLRHDLGGGHPLVGRNVPAFALADGTSPAALMRDGRGLLLDFDGLPALRRLARGWGGRVRYAGVDARDRLGLSALLVRPDGTVAWACEGPPRLDEAAEAASRWFAPTAARTAAAASSPPRPAA